MHPIKDIKAAKAVKQKLLDTLPILTHPHFRGAGVGLKIKDGQKVVVAQVFVEKKMAEDELHLKGIPVLPKTVDGMEIDVVEMSTLPVPATVNPPHDSAYYRDYHRPLERGIQINNGGTLGTFVRMGTLFAQILTNKHVVARADETEVGQYVYQPVWYANDSTANMVATVTRLSTIDFSPSVLNKVDGALARIKAGISYIAEELVQAPNEIDSYLGVAVEKYGRTTAHTTGVITAVDVTIKVNYGTADSPKVASHEQQFHVKPTDTSDFILPRDSGSVILIRDTNQIIGLITAFYRGYRSDGTYYSGSYSSPVANVVEALGITKFL
jgi:uncharacterized alkaline shock family protein YloU